MTSILSGLDTVKQALAAQQFALNVTQRNVANAGNPDYTRQEVLFNPISTEQGFGSAAVMLRAVRDRFLDGSIRKELQSLGENTAAFKALQQVDGILGGSGGENLQSALSRFFNSFSALTSAPEDLVLRQQVISSGNALAAEFRRLSGGIQQVQVSQDRAVSFAVNDINALTARIADLNKRIQIARQSGSESEFALSDTRQQMLEQLSGLIDVSCYDTESGSITVTTKQGGLLVLEDRNHTLEATRLKEDAFLRLQLDGKDITDALESGELGGLVDARDNLLAGYLESLDEMAAGTISRVNEQHALGRDLDGAAGGNFFAPFVEMIPGSNAGAARSMRVSVADPRLIAAAGDGTGPGGNANAQLLAGIRSEKMFASASETVHQFYARLVYEVGTGEKTAEDGMLAPKGLLEQLRNQRSASSGVSLDEEAVNIIKYQKAYQASARLASVLDTLSSEVLQILGA